jgi:hypothetical protein
MIFPSTEGVLILGEDRRVARRHATREQFERHHELYDDVCEDLTLMGCGRFHGYVEAFREIWADK